MIFVYIPVAKYIGLYVHVTIFSYCNSFHALQQCPCFAGAAHVQQPAPDCPVGVLQLPFLQWLKVIPNLNTLRVTNMIVEKGGKTAFLYQPGGTLPCDVFVGVLFFFGFSPHSQGYTCA